MAPQQPQPSRYVGREIPSLSTEQINQFLAAHPLTADNPSPHVGGTTGELQAIDTNEALDRVSLIVMARDCDAVIEAAASFSQKQEACQAKVDTLVRMMNPELATEECIVYEKADELAYDFMTEQALLYRDHGVSLDTLSAMENPADQLRADFKAHVDTVYDVPRLQAHASTVLAEYVNPIHRRDFETLVGFERIDDPSRVQIFGAHVTSRLISL